MQQQEARDPQTKMRFLTVAETAEALNVCIDSVRRYLRAGKLRGTKLGKEWRIPESELTRLAGSGPTVSFGHKVSKERLRHLLTPEVLDYLLLSARQAAERAGVREASKRELLVAELRATLCEEVGLSD